MSSCRTGLTEARALGSHRSHGVEEVQEGNPAEGLQPCGSLWVVVVVGSHNIYHGKEDSFGKSRLPCTEDNPVALSNPWRVGFYQSMGHRCGDLRDVCFLHGWDIPCLRRLIAGNLN